MNSSSEFSLESKACSFSFLLKSFCDELEKTHKLEDLLSRLEEERLKIDAFKRELPLCMQLLNDVMEASRQQLAVCQVNRNPRPVLEEFIPLKHPETPERNLNIADATASSPSSTANWMATAQMWSQSDDGSKNQGPAVSVEPEHGLVGSSKLVLDVKQRIGGAFLPFSKERNGATQQALKSQLPDLALAPGDKNADEPKMPETVELAVSISRIKATDQSNVSQGNCNGGGSMVGGGSSGATDKASGNEVQAAAGSQTHRKPRRCWSPDLHRRFVNALQQLGGSQVATPKQIRELMKVDGLTNDEVKSHLQKYRLHTRRPSPTPQAVTPSAPQLVVLGGIWVPPEYATAAHHTAAPGIYGATIAAAAAAQSASAPPPHYCHPSPLPQDFCTQLSTPAHHQVRHIYCEQQMTANHNGNNNIIKEKDNNNISSSSDDNNNKLSSNSRSSPRSSTAGERSQGTGEEGKSESGSWRGESTENVGREMGRALSLRRRATLRSEEEEDGEESTGSDITLKF